MPTIVIANPKGGVGKSTLATNLAGLFARAGHAVMLGDADKQQSSRQWLALRPPGLPPIRTWEVDRDAIARAPHGTTHVVLDTPAGLGGKRLEAVLRIADKVLVPLQPSLFDINATHAFLQQVLAHRRAGEIAVGVVGMRVREHTFSNDRLHDWMSTLRVPVVTVLRETQNYVHLAAHGLTLWDVAPSRVERDVDQWLPLVDWVVR